MFANGFKCYRCGSDQVIDFNGYVCPACGGNLEVTYDYARIRDSMDPGDLEGGDLFRYVPLLPVERMELASPLRVGMTPLYRASRLGEAVGLKNLYLKDDGLNPSASFKDRAGALALVRAREMGAEIIAGASTGNAGSSMACLTASVGVPCVIFVPENAPPAKIAQLLVFGARVFAVRGSYDDAFDLCMEICTRHGWFNRNTGYNPFTREGKKTAAFEICEQLGWKAPDRVIVPTGDGNIISGIWKGFRDFYELGWIDKLPKIDCAQSINSAAVVETIRKLETGNGNSADMDWSTIKIEPVMATTVADSISVDMPRDGVAAVRAVIESGGHAVTVDDGEILSAIPELARKAGVFAEPAAACGWACLKKLAETGAVSPEEQIVCLITGNGLKDVGAARKAAGEPTVIEASVDAAEAAINSMP